MKVKIVLRHGTAFVLTDDEAQNVDIEIVGCDDCSIQKWTEEIDESNMKETKNLTVTIAKDGE